MNEQIDPDTGLPHQAPLGLEHQKARTSAKGVFYCDVKMRHYIIKKHQEAFPELAEKMKYNPDAPNIYAAFLAMLPLQIKGKLTDELRRKIMKTYKLL